MRDDLRWNHLELLLQPAGAEALAGKVPNGGESSGRFAAAVRAAIRKSRKVRVNGRSIKADDVEHAAAVLATAHDGCASTAGLTVTAEMNADTVEAGMTFLPERGIIADMGNGNWAVAG